MHVNDGWTDSADEGQTPRGLASIALIDTRKPTEYDAAVTLLSDLQALAERDGHDDTFTARASRCGKPTRANPA